MPYQLANTTDLNLQSGKLTQQLIPTFYQYDDKTLKDSWAALYHWLTELTQLVEIYLYNDTSHKVDRLKQEEILQNHWLKRELILDNFANALKKSPFLAGNTALIKQELSNYFATLNVTDHTNTQQFEIKATKPLTQDLIENFKQAHQQKTQLAELTINLNSYSSAKKVIDMLHEELKTKLEIPSHNLWQRIKSIDFLNPRVLIPLIKTLVITNTSFIAANAKPNHGEGHGTTREIDNWPLSLARVNQPLSMIAPLKPNLLSGPNIGILAPYNQTNLPIQPIITKIRTPDYARLFLSTKSLKEFLKSSTYRKASFQEKQKFCSHENFYKELVRIIDKDDSKKLEVLLKYTAHSLLIKNTESYSDVDPIQKNKGFNSNDLLSLSIKKGSMSCIRTILSKIPLNSFSKIITPFLSAEKDMLPNQPYIFYFYTIQVSQTDLRPAEKQQIIEILHDHFVHEKPLNADALTACLDFGFEYDNLFLQEKCISTAFMRTHSGSPLTDFPQEKILHLLYSAILHSASDLSTFYLDLALEKRIKAWPSMENSLASSSRQVFYEQIKLTPFEPFLKSSLILKLSLLGSTNKNLLGSLKLFMEDCSNDSEKIAFLATLETEVLKRIYLLLRAEQHDEESAELPEVLKRIYLLLLTEQHDEESAKLYEFTAALLHLKTPQFLSLTNLGKHQSYYVARQLNSLDLFREEIEALKFIQKPYFMEYIFYSFLCVIPSFIWNMTLISRMKTHINQQNWCSFIEEVLSTIIEKPKLLTKKDPHSNKVTVVLSDPERRPKYITIKSKHRNKKAVTKLFLQYLNNHLNKDPRLFNQELSHEKLDEIIIDTLLDLEKTEQVLALYNSFLADIISAFKTDQLIETLCDEMSILEKELIQFNLKKPIVEINKEIYSTSEQIYILKQILKPEEVLQKEQEGTFTIDYSKFFIDNFPDISMPELKKIKVPPSKLTEKKIQLNECLKQRTTIIQSQAQKRLSTKKNKKYPLKTKQLEDTFLHETPLNKDVAEEKAILDLFQLCNEQKQQLIKLTKNYNRLYTLLDTKLKELERIQFSDFNESTIETDEAYNQAIKHYEGQINNITTNMEETKKIEKELSQTKITAKRKQTEYRQNIDKLHKQLATRASASKPSQDSFEFKEESSDDSEHGADSSSETNEEPIVLIQGALDNTGEKSREGSPEQKNQEKTPETLPIGFFSETGTGEEAFSLVNTTQGWLYHRVEDIIQQLKFNLTELKRILNYLQNFNAFLQTDNILVTYLLQDNPEFLRILFTDAIKNYLFRIHHLLAEKQKKTPHSSKSLYLFGPSLGQQANKIRNQFRHKKENFEVNTLLDYTHAIIPLYEGEASNDESCITHLLTSLLDKKDAQQKITSLKHPNLESIAYQLSTSNKTNLPMVSLSNPQETINETIKKMKYTYLVMKRIYEEFSNPEKQENSLAVAFGFDNLHQLFSMIEWQVVCLNNLLDRGQEKNNLSKAFCKALRKLSNHIAHRTEVCPSNNERDIEQYKSDLKNAEQKLIKACLDKLDAVVTHLKQPQFYGGIQENHAPSPLI